MGERTDRAREESIRQITIYQPCDENRTSIGMLIHLLQHEEILFIRGVIHNGWHQPDYAWQHLQSAL